MRADSGTATAGPLARGNATLRFAAIFLALLLLFEAAIEILSATGAILPLARLTAQATGLIANSTGVPATVSGVEIFLQNRILVIIAECLGVYMIAAFSALVLAYPTTWSAKGRALLLGIPAILLANLLRLGLVVHAEERLPAAFPVLHDYLFQVAMILFVLGAWGLWVGRLGRDER